MAQHIDNIEYNEVNTINDIKEYQQETIDVTNQIENTDMVSLNNIYNTKMRFIQSNFPQSPQKDMGVFITFNS